MSHLHLAWGRNVMARMLESRPRPTGGMFSPGKENLDPRVFGEGEKVRPELREAILATLDGFWRPRYGDWTQWAKVFLAGSAASYWWDSDHDLDVLIGIDKDALDQARPQNVGVSELDVCQHFDKEFKEELDLQTKSFTGGFEATFFCNADSYNIANLHPYAAYDLTVDGWVVHPPEVPRSWGPDDFPDAMWQEANRIADQIESILRRPEPERTLEGVELFGYLHTLRQRSYGPNGKGWMDYGNFLWQALSQWHILQPLWRLNHATQATAVTSSDESAWSHSTHGGSRPTDGAGERVAVHSLQPGRGDVEGRSGPGDEGGSVSQLDRLVHPEKTAARTTMYHVSSSKNHVSIMEYGLDGSKNPRGGYVWTGDVRGQYLFGSLGTAKRAAIRDFIDPYVYEVDVTGLAVEVDARMPDAFVVRESISPDRVRLVGRKINSPYGEKIIPVAVTTSCAHTSIHGVEPRSAAGADVPHDMQARPR